MKRLLTFAIVIVSCCTLLAADPAWQYGRIVEIHKSTTTTTRTWIANTPITDDITTCTISVVVGTTLLIGNYEITDQKPEPPSDWTKGYAVKVQVTGGALDLRSPTEQLWLHLKQTKNTTKPMEPITAFEKKHLDETDATADSLVGFSSQNKAGSKTQKAEAQAAPEAAPATPAPPPASTGTVTVRSVPFLSEVFVEGASMGYTPAKIALPPGKHVFRVEKAGYHGWSKEVTVTVGSELTLDATLEKK